MKKVIILLVLVGLGFLGYKLYTTNRYQYNFKFFWQCHHTENLYKEIADQYDLYTVDDTDSMLNQTGYCSLFATCYTDETYIKHFYKNYTPAEVNEVITKCNNQVVHKIKTVYTPKEVKKFIKKKLGL